MTTDNRGDPVVLYDPVVGRWLVSDFAWFNQSTGPFYQCIAVSQTSDPVSGGWYFYALQADTGDFHRLPQRLPEAGCLVGRLVHDRQHVPDDRPLHRLWRAPVGARPGGDDQRRALRERVHFDCTDLDCASLLPANLRGRCRRQARRRILYLPSLRIA